MRIEDEPKRRFYINECAKSNWSVRQLERQINTFSYERLLANHGNRAGLIDTERREPAKKPEDVIRDPYVLEFLGLEQMASFYESDIE